MKSSHIYNYKEVYEKNDNDTKKQLNKPIKLLYNEITKTGILETYYIKSMKKYIGGSKNMDSSYITKKRGIYANGIN